MLQAQSLAELPGIRHAFFTRAGGVSEGIYESLNGGVGSNDDAGQGRGEPRPHGGGARRRAGAFPDRYQIHSPDVVVAETPWTREDAAARRRHRDARCRASRSASRPPIAGRCCLPTREARVIGAAHAGWRGALTGVIEATIAAMEKLGAQRARHRRRGRPDDPPAELRGRPGIRRPLRRASSRTPSASSSRRRAPATPCSIWPATSRRGCGEPSIGRIEDLGLCTYADPERFYSLPPLDASGGAGLWPACQCDRAGRLTTSGSSAELGGWTAAEITVTNSVRGLAASNKRSGDVGER